MNKQEYHVKVQTGLNRYLFFMAVIAQPLIIC